MNHFLAQKPLGSLAPIGGYPPEGEGASVTITKIFSNLFAVLTIAAGIWFIINFIVGGISWIASSGQPDKVQKAQNKMTHSAIGLIAVIVAYGIAVIVGQILGFNILNPAYYIERFWQ